MQGICQSLYILTLLHVCIELIIIDAKFGNDADTEVMHQTKNPYTGNFLCIYIHERMHLLIYEYFIFLNFLEIHSKVIERISKFINRGIRSIKISTYCTYYSISRTLPYLDGEALHRGALRYWNDSLQPQNLWILQLLPDLA